MLNLRKIPHYLALLLLTAGASLILGFLSFGGMFALWPVLPVALAAFGLSVAYEGEIYLQNIKGALTKLFKNNYLERQIAKEYLLKHFTTDEGCPAFFKDYEAQLNLLHHFGHKRLDKESRKRKKQVEKTLRDMEKWFARQLFAEKNDSQDGTAYEHELSRWLVSHQQDEYRSELKQRRRKFNAVKAFSILAGIFMGLGTTYLLVEAFTTISLAAWPLMIVPMAIIAGTAYGLLTYNAVTDMITNNTLLKWYHKIRNDLRDSLSVRHVFIATTAVLLLTLALALTICTAGTWWTIAKETRPLFAWMGKMPGFIMGIINPIITGLSAVVFNLQNTSESLDIIDEATRTTENLFSRMGQSIRDGFNALRGRENWLQMLNPFRLLLKITITPLRIVLFLGHLISIGVTADRVPGISQVVSALLGIISEGFEDAHYFIGQQHTHGNDDTQALLEERLNHEGGHNHDADIPTRFLKLMFAPVYFVAAIWDYLTSKLNQEPRSSITLARAWEKQIGVKPEKIVELPQSADRPSSAWRVEHAIYRIERHKEKQLKGVIVGQGIATTKSEQLTRLQTKLRQLSASEDPTTLLTDENRETYNRHRFFSIGPTRTATFLDGLPQRINSSFSGLTKNSNLCVKNSF